MFKKLTTLWIILLAANSVYANPAPLGLEIGKATLEDVKKQYTITSSANNATSGYYNYYIDPKETGIDDVSKAVVICDDSDVVNAMFLDMPKTKFDAMAQMLREKYKVINQNIPHVGNAYVNLKDGDCEIELKAPHMSFDMTLSYITERLINAYQTRIKAEEAAKQAKEKSML